MERENVFLNKKTTVSLTDELICERVITLPRGAARTPEKIQEKDRSSHQRCSIEIGVLKSFTKFTGKHLCQSLFFNKVAGLRPATY